MSPVYSATATAGHLLRVAVMPTPADTSISLLRPQPETVARTAVPHSRTSDLRVEGRLRVMMIWLSIQARSEEHTSELQSLMRISYAVFCLKKKKKKK